MIVGQRVQIVKGTPCCGWRDNHDIGKMGVVDIDDLPNCQEEPPDNDMRWLVRLDDGLTFWYNTDDLEAV